MIAVIKLLDMKKSMKIIVYRIHRTTSVRPFSCSINEAHKANVLLKAEKFLSYAKLLDKRVNNKIAACRREIHYQKDRFIQALGNFTSAVLEILC